MIRILCLHKQACRVGVDESRLAPGSFAGFEDGEIAYKDSFELYAVGTAFRFARVMKNALLIGQVEDSGIGNLLRLPNQFAMAGLPGEFGKSTQDDALVIAPDNSLIVPAGRVRPSLIW